MLYAEAEEAGLLVPLSDAPWWATPVTSMFMHASLLHIAFNMIFLFVFGGSLERILGRARYLAFYVLAGIAAVYAQTLFDPDAVSPVIGASGAISGVLGGYLLLNPQARILNLIPIPFFVTFVEVPATVLIAIWFLLPLIPVVGEVATADTAYLAHVGGFVFGLATIKLWAGRKRAGPGDTAAPSPKMA